MNKLVTAIVIGAGQRGTTYSQYALIQPDKFKIVGVAEPSAEKRQRMCKEHSIVEKYTFSCWTEIVKINKFADCAIITTLDHMHKEPAIALASKGYHILLEKPIAPTYEDCCQIVKCCEDNNVMLAIGHVLRYDPHSILINNIISSGAIGNIVNIQHLEPIGYWHFTHSFVRGNWRNADSSSFMLLAKCCHDLDLIQMWMGNAECVSISSFGSLFHFKHSNKPVGSSDRCLTCPIEPTCQFSAKKLYLELYKGNSSKWPGSVICENQSTPDVTFALMNGPYGRCVYNCDNNVVDNQVVIMQYDTGATVNFSTVAYTEFVCARQTKIFGTKGELTCNYNEAKLSVFDFLTNKKVEHVVGANMSLSGHKEADVAAIKSFVNAISINDPSYILTGAKVSLKSHMLCFAAEEARLKSKIINIKDGNYKVCSQELF